MAQRKRKAKPKTRIQFSKKQIAAVMIFWCVVRLFSVLAVFLNPPCATGMARIIEGIDQIAMINCLAYTGNSISEKIGLGYFQYKQAVAATEEQDEEEKSNG